MSSHDLGLLALISIALLLLELLRLELLLLELLLLRLELVLWLELGELLGVAWMAGICRGHTTWKTRIVTTIINTLPHCNQQYH